jgi:TRAP-type transport system periplasmic protein
VAKHGSDLAVRFAGYQGQGSILTQALVRLKDQYSSLEIEQSIRVEGDVTSSGESAGALFKSVEDGERELCYVASGYLTARVPELSVLDLAFSVSDRNYAMDCLDGQTGAYLARAVAEKTGFKVLGFWDNGFRHISNNIRPIQSPVDCAGLIIRTLDSENYRSSLNALGFTALTTDVRDMVTMIASGEVQAQENPLTNFLKFSIDQHHQYLSLTSHFFGVLLVVCNRNWFEKLSTAMQQSLLIAVTEVSRLQRQDAANEDEIAIAKIECTKLKLMRPDQLDLRAMKAAVAKVNSDQKKRIPRELLAAYLRQQT